MDDLSGRVSELSIEFKDFKSFIVGEVESLWETFHSRLNRFDVVVDDLKHRLLKLEIGKDKEGEKRKQEMVVTTRYQTMTSV